MVIKVNLKLITNLFVLVLVSISLFLHYETTSVIAEYNSTKTKTLPIVMYHHITENKDRAGKYTVTTDEFRDDLAYLKKQGYTAVDTDMLINFVYYNKQLPEKPVMITFDDGFESFYVLAKPILEEYETKASVFVLGSLADKYSSTDDHNINYSYLNWEEIEKINESPLLEVNSHTYDLHYNVVGQRKGMKKLKNESMSDYKKIINDDLKKMNILLKTKTGKTPNALAYPYGIYSDDITVLAKKNGFKLTFTCEERINTVKQGNFDTLYNLGRFNRPSGISSQKFFSEILK